MGFSEFGILFGISQTSNNLLAISTTNGTGVPISPVSLTSAFDLAFRPEDNTMFVADTNTESLYTLNPPTGEATLVGPYGSNTNVVGLEFFVPEPGTILLLGASLSLLAWRARRVS